MTRIFDDDLSDLTPGFSLSSVRTHQVTGLIVCSVDTEALVVIYYLLGDEVYFNNCSNRKHELLYGENAFYDLNTVGHQAQLAKELRPGDTCIVLSYDDYSRSIVALSWYQFKEERLMADEKGMLCRVFFGGRKKTEFILKSDAVKSERYHHLFSKVGHFKQFSVSL